MQVQKCEWTTVIYNPSKSNNYIIKAWYTFTCAIQWCVSLGTLAHRSRPTMWSFPTCTSRFGWPRSTTMRMSVIMTMSARVCMCPCPHHFSIHRSISCTQCKNACNFHPSEKAKHLWANVSGITLARDWALLVYSHVYMPLGQSCQTLLRRWISPLLTWNAWKSIV